MRTETTNRYQALTQVAGLLGGGLLTAVLVVAVVLATLGLGAETAGGGRLLPPAPPATAIGD